jgi:hypothetical protein
MRERNFVVNSNCKIRSRWSEGPAIFALKILWPWANRHPAGEAWRSSSREGGMNKNKTVFSREWWRRLGAAGSGLLFTFALCLPFSAIASGTVTLAWNASNDPLVLGYNLYCGGVSGVYTNIIAAGNATNITVSGLVGGRKYYFAATTTGILGLESIFSGEVAYVVPTRAILYIQIGRSNGVPVSISITANGMIPNQWILQSSTNLEKWTAIAQGTNLPVNFFAATKGVPMQFFRLLGQ